MKTVAKKAYNEGLRHKQDELAVQYLPAVKAMAFRLKERLPSSVDYSDLAAIGTEELVKLARRYDASQNDSFWGYSKKRVYGAMLDYLRSLDIMSRATRKLVKAIDVEVLAYMAKYEHEPTNEELAQKFGEPIKKIKEARVASEIYSVMPLHEQLSEPSSNTTMEEIEKDNLIDIIKNVLGEFSKRDQMIIQLYYFEELSLKEISSILDITESRISQIHKSVLKKIRLSLGEDLG